MPPLGADELGVIRQAFEAQAGPDGLLPPTGLPDLLSVLLARSPTPAEVEAFAQALGAAPVSFAAFVRLGMGVDPQPVFGVSPEQPVVRAFVRRLIGLLDDRHLRAEGLWRVAGSKAGLDQAISRVKAVGQSALDEVEDPHTLAQLAVRLLMDIPGRLVGGEARSAALAAHRAGDSSELAAGLMRRLSPAACGMLADLVGHWQRVVAAENRMDARAVGTCVFGALFDAPELALIQVTERLLELPADVLRMLGGGDGAAGT